MPDMCSKSFSFWLKILKELNVVLNICSLHLLAIHLIDQLGKSGVMNLQEFQWGLLERIGNSKGSKFV